MVKKILSIDFDIIMYPCIKMYNDKVGGEANSTQLWQGLENDLDISNILSYDWITLKNIAQLIAKSKNVHFIKEHQKVVDILKSTAGWSEDTYELTNVDFHHDLWYRQSDLAAITDFDQYNCSDWAGYLLLKNKLVNNHYTWLKAPNSDMPLQFDNIEYKLDLLKIRDFGSLLEQDFDEVFFCLSPQWVPYKYSKFYDIIQLMYEYTYSM